MNQYQTLLHLLGTAKEVVFRENMDIQEAAWSDAESYGYQGSCQKTGRRRSLTAYE